MLGIEPSLPGDECDVRVYCPPPTEELSRGAVTPRTPRSHAPRGNARPDAPRRVCDSRDAERPAVRSHAERGNEGALRVRYLSSFSLSLFSSLRILPSGLTWASRFFLSAVTSSTS